MRKTYPVLLSAAVLLSFGFMGASSAAHQDCCHPSAVKSGNSAALATTSAKPMSSLNAEDVRKEFNASSEKVRVVALLSPTCPDCQSGHAAVGRILRKFPSPKLRAIFVWEPMRGGDNAANAAQHAASVQDVRIAKLFGDTLDIHQVAWDVYLVYKPGVKWEGPRPPRPTFWMHQLEGVDPNLLLCVNPTRLSEEVGKLMAQSN